MSQLLIVVSAPSGAGKTSLVRALVERDSNLEVSVSYTTRPRRPAEVDGRDYRFVSQATFNAMARGGDLLEYATNFGFDYGTSQARVREAQAAGRDVVLEIDWQGAQQVRAQLDDAIGVFVLPPSREALRARLEGRGQDGPDVIERRMRQAIDDMTHCAEFDYAIVNDDFEDCRGSPRPHRHRRAARRAGAGARHRRPARGVARYALTRRPRASRLPTSRTCALP